MKGVYLAACKARHSNYDIVYNDVDKKYNCDLTCDMLDVNLNDYDFIIASPPCNYYSRANYRRNSSLYSLNTKHLLPDIIYKLVNNCMNKYWIVENVRNPSLMKDIFDFCNRSGVFIYEHGRHTYFTNIMINISGIPQSVDFHSPSYARIHCCSTEPCKTRNGYRQGGDNVYNVIEWWLEYIHNLY